MPLASESSFVAALIVHERIWSDRTTDGKLDNDRCDNCYAALDLNAGRGNWAGCCSRNCLLALWGRDQHFVPQAGLKLCYGCGEERPEAIFHGRNWCSRCVGARESDPIQRRLAGEQRAAGRICLSCKGKLPPRADHRSPRCAACTRSYWAAFNEKRRQRTLAAERSEARRNELKIQKELANDPTLRLCHGGCKRHLPPGDFATLPELGTDGGWQASRCCRNCLGAMGGWSKLSKRRVAALRLPGTRESC